MNFATQIEHTLFAFKEVYSKAMYWIISILVALVIILSNILAINYSLLEHMFTWKLLFLLILGGFVSTPPFSLFVLFLIAILGGISVSLGVYVMKRQLSSGVTGISGLILGVIAPACPSCALGLISLIGLGGIFAILPFRGLELNWIIIILLLASIWYLTRKIVGVCKVN